MKTKPIFLFVALIVATSLFASNVITYTATSKLPETTSKSSYGLHTDAFNVSISSHTFSKGTGTITFKGEITTIGSHAFYGCSGLTSITIPNSVTSIENDAFSGCSGLTSVTIPNSVTTIGSLAFRDCTGLTSVTIGNSVTKIGNLAFHNCTGLTSLEISNSVTTIGSSAFQGCSSLTSVTIPNSVTTIGHDAFYGCSGLTSVTIPNSVTTIGQYAFYGCSGLTSIQVLEGNTKYDSRDNCNALIETATNTLITGCQNTIIPNSVTTIESSAFRDCSGLISVTIPNSVTTIESSAFRDCSGLISVTIPNSVTTIGDNAFYGCSGLTSVTIGNSVTTIGNYAFYGCSVLASITIPNSVTTIGSVAFYGCNSLTKTNYIGIIADWCKIKFYDNPICYSHNFYINDVEVKDLVIPEGVDTIGDKAFVVCKGLTSVTIPNSVTTIGQYAFEGCSGLTSITSYATTPPICGNECFYHVPSSISVYVPARSVDAYKKASGWMDFMHRIKGNPNDYAIVTCSATNGTIKGGGKYIKDDECTMTATANYGYHFVQWNDGITDNPRTIQVLGDTTFTAEFAKNQYLISVKAEHGEVDGGGNYDYLSSAQISATADEHYHFVKWSDGNTSNPRTISVTENKTYTAVFALDQHIVFATANHGMVSGAGKYDYGKMITLTVISDAGYRFTQWYDGNIDNPRSFIVTQDTTFIAQFAINQYTFIVQSADNIMGSVTGGGTYDYQSQLTITATANYGYCFLKWNDGITDNPRNFTLTKDSTFIAQFTPQNYQVTVQNANPTMGGVFGSGSYSYLSAQTISATANYGYHFVRWNDGITDNPRTIQVLGDTTFMAEFAKNQYLISVEAEHGKVDGGGNYDYLSLAQISATADEHYHFVKWSDGNTSNPRTISVTENKTYTAVFALDQHIVSATANHGMVSGAGKYDYGKKITLTVIPNVGYQFTQWKDGNTSNPRSFILTQDTSFIAQIDTIWSGACGDDLTWKYGDGVLVISGTGAMYDYTQDTAPWMLFFQESISSLVINNGCTSIGNFAFYGLSNKNLKTIDIPNSVEQIGQYAFANCEYVKNLYLGLSLEKIAANAFANDERLLYITCYAIEPPLLDESAFVNYDAYLSVPCESQADYKVAKGWKKFNKENVSCIGAEETPVTTDEVTVAPEANQATFTWPQNDQAAGYSIEITKDGVVFCTLKFNAQGQLTGIAFAPSRGGARELASAMMTANGWQFTVTGLNQASKYGYTLDVLNASQQSIKHYQGEFTTTGATGLEWLTVDNGASAHSDKCTVRKFIRHNQLQIMRNDKLFNALGGRIR